MFGHDDALIHGEVLMIDLLIVLVTLTCQHDHIVGQCIVHGVVNGLDAVGLHHILRAFRHACEDLADDEHGVLRAGIVGGDNGEVGQPCGDFAHDGALGAVAVTAAAEHTDELALRMGIACLEKSDYEI